MLQARVRRNYARIQAAAVEVASDRGWSGMTLAGVGRAAGLTIRPVRDRYPTRALLGAATWTEVAGPAMQSALTDALTSGGLLDQPANEDSFSDAMDAFARPDGNLRAAAELAVVSCFEPELADAVTDSLGHSVRIWLDPAKAGSPVLAAKRGYLVALALGLIAMAHRPGLTDLDLAPQWRHLLTALAAKVAAVPLPDEPRPPHLARIPFDTGDATTDDLLRAAIDRLGRHGYEGTLLTSVAADAGVSEASVFVRYPSKEAFIMDAIDRQQDIALPSHREHLARLEAAHGTGIAEAIAIRGTMHPSERLQNVIEMERARLTWHRPELAAADEARLQQVIHGILAKDPAHPDYSDPAGVHLARSLGLGISFLPLIDDEAWDLPYDVITTTLALT